MAPAICHADIIMLQQNVSMTGCFKTAYVLFVEMKVQPHHADATAEEAAIRQ